MNDETITVGPESPFSDDATALIAALSAELGATYGHDGSGAFRPEDGEGPGRAFLVARLDGRAVGCGALRPLEPGVAEVKRMYVAEEARGRGIAARVLDALERTAAAHGYARVKLETGTLQAAAIRLYQRAGYTPCPCYGRYVGDPTSRCFEKTLGSPRAPSGRPLRLVTSSPDWPAWFAAEAERIRRAAGALLRGVEHVGSTSVPGLLAKPVIDVALAVDSGADADALVAPLEAIDYEHRGMHGDDPRRRYFTRDVEGERRFQLHAWILPARGWEEHRAFRDLLRARPDLAAAYAAEKLRVAAEVGSDKAAYSIAKGPFIERLLREHGIRA